MRAPSFSIGSSVQRDDRAGGGYKISPPNSLHIKVFINDIKHELLFKANSAQNVPSFNFDIFVAFF